MSETPARGHAARKAGGSALAVLAIASTYGFLAVYSVDLLLHGYPHGSSQVSSDASQFVVSVIWLCFGLFLALIACVTLSPRGQRGLVRTWLAGFKPPRPGRGLVVVSAALAADGLGYWLYAAADAWRRLPSPEPDPVTRSLVYDAAYGVVWGGIGEELLVLALPVVVARAIWPSASRMWVGLGMVSLVALRLSYHAYQGYGAWSHLPWAVAAIALYLWSGRVWPQIIAHGLYDVAVSLLDHGAISAPVFWVGMLALIVAGARTGFIRLEVDDKVRLREALRRLIPIPGL